MESPLPRIGGKAYLGSKVNRSPCTTGDVEYPRVSTELKQLFVQLAMSEDENEEEYYEEEVIEEDVTTEALNDNEKFCLDLWR